MAEVEELLRGRSVKEVREIAQRVRAEADEKRSALRDRAGSGYSTLLATADQVHRMHSTATDLLNHLQRAHELASEAAPAADALLSSEGSSDSRSSTLLSEATRVKHIVDAPEACFSALDEHQPLDAALALESASSARSALHSSSPDFESRYPVVSHSHQTEPELRSEIFCAASNELNRSALHIDPPSAARLLCALALCSTLDTNDGSAGEWLLSCWLSAIEQCAFSDMQCSSSSASQSLSDALTGIAHAMRTAESLFAHDGFVLAEIKRRRLEEDWSERQRELVRLLTLDSRSSEHPVRSRVREWLLEGKDPACDRLAAACASTCLQRVHSLDELAELERTCAEHSAKEYSNSANFDLWKIMAQSVCAERARELAVAELQMISFQALVDDESALGGAGEIARSRVCDKLRSIRKQVCQLKCVADSSGDSLALARRAQSEGVSVMRDGAQTLRHFAQEHGTASEDDSGANTDNVSLAGRIASALARGDDELSVFFGQPELWQHDGKESSGQSSTNTASSAIDRFRAKRRQRQGQSSATAGSTENACAESTMEGASTALSDVRKAMRHAALYAFGIWAEMAGDTGRAFVKQRVGRPGELNERPVWVTTSREKYSSKGTNASEDKESEGEACIESPGMCSSGMMRALFHCAKETARAGCSSQEAVEAMRDVLRTKIGEYLSELSGAYESEDLRPSMEHMCTTDDLAHLSFDVDFALRVLGTRSSVNDEAESNDESALSLAQKALESRLDPVDREAASLLRRRAMDTALRGSAVLLGPLRCTPYTQSCDHSDSESSDEQSVKLHDADIPEPVPRFSLLPLPSQKGNSAQEPPPPLPVVFQQ